MATAPPASGFPDEDKGPQILAACTSLTLIALLCVCLRFYVRIKVVKSIGHDDYAILVAMALALVGMGLTFPEVYYGAGRHAHQLTPASIEKGMLLNFVSQPFYLWGTTFAKMSISLFLLRLTPVLGYKRFLWGLIVFMLVYTTVAFFGLLFSCNPVSELWDASPEARCFNPASLEVTAYMNVGLNILTDLILSILPVPMIWGLQMSKRTKVALVVILGLGVLTECNAGILAASIPPIRPLFRGFLDKTFIFRRRPGQNDSYPLDRTDPIARQDGGRPGSQAPLRSPNVGSPQKVGAMVRGDNSLSLDVEKGDSWTMRWPRQTSDETRGNSVFDDV
ncbi:MAG: hypothetical protein M1832_003727 [Thelocarpon impressellum]|nr:MAG: hypothetical protein M1832_003727 [Thelocarpon impressellum]